MGGQTSDGDAYGLSAERLAVLEEIERRVLWLSTRMVHHANRVRPNRTGIKVGGHQASSASVVSVMTSLFFDFMRAGDRISVKPHASPVLHAIHYLMGRLDRRYLTTLRSFGGLQAYPSRTKDPDPVDFSTGSVGLGSVAPNFAALTDRFVTAHFVATATSGARYLSLLGDAELDEGSIWEAVAEPALMGLDNVIWIVDLNRQSLDRVVPGIRIRQLEGMFAANGWTVLEAKYGRRLQAAFAGSGGERLRERIDDLSNEHYQLLLRSGASAVREALGCEVLDAMDDDAVTRMIADLGGHDQVLLHELLREADASPAPAVIFAYTVKGWGLPVAGDPLNHSALLTDADVERLRVALGIDEADPWPVFDAGTAAGELCRERAAALEPVRRAAATEALDVPADLGLEYRGSTSTQASFGQVLTDLARQHPATARRLVTVSPDVATSTNLGGWINKVGVWNAADEPDEFAALGPRIIRWNRGSTGQHIELGISETNLLMMLGQLGMSAETTGEPLLPVGTLYDPFVARALDALIYSLYGGGRFILVGTPSGITLAPEGGAHQSVITPSIGVATPGLTYWEPCFAQELEWVFLDALRRLHDPVVPASAYLRLTTASVDQSLLAITDRELMRNQVLSGAYRLVDRRTEPGCRLGVNHVEVWATGVMVPHAVRASDDLVDDEVFVSVVNCLSPDLVYRRWQDAAHHRLSGATTQPLPWTGGSPVVTVLDGHPSGLAWVGSMLGTPVLPLGVTSFGQSGTTDDLYAAARIDAASIAAACVAVLG